MSPGLIVIIMLVGLLGLLVLGLPIAFITSGIGLLILAILYGPDFLIAAVTSILEVSNNLIYVAVPLFILMGTILESSRIAEDLYGALHAWLGSLRGGLAMGTVVICCIFAAMVGIAGAEIVIMGLIALPSMLKYKYDKSIALGTILAGGGLGQLIPPSLLFIAYGAEAGISVGKLFQGGLPAGLILGALFIIYIGVRSFFQKELCPTVPPEERAPLREKLILLKALILPGLLILFVLGSIFTGIATPSEAASVGVVGAVISALVNRRFNKDMFKKALITALRVNCMIMFIIIGAKCYSLALVASGGMRFLQESFISILGTLNPYVALAWMFFGVFVLGMFLEPMTIIIITIPIFMPIVKSFGFDPTWFGVVYVVCIQLGFITPPFGYSCFFLKGVAPDNITLEDIYRSVTPFVIIECIGIAIMIAFPSTITWILG